MQKLEMEVLTVEGDTCKQHTGCLPLYDLQRPLLPGFIPYDKGRRQREEEQRRDDQRPHVQGDIPYWQPKHDSDSIPLEPNDRGVTIMDLYSN